MRIHDANGVSPSLASEEGRGQGVPTVAFQETGKGWWKESDTGGTLRERDYRDGMSNIVAFDRTQATVSGEVAGPLRACGARSKGVSDGKAGTQCVVIKGAAIGRKPEAGPQYGEILEDGTCYTLNTVETHAALTDIGVRRLMPIECEKLQGFPAGWTAVNGMSDTARYKMLGNAVAVPVAEWIGRRIVEVERRGK